MLKKAFPDLVEGVRPIGKILGVSHEQVRILTRKGLIPVTRLNDHHIANYDALVECEKHGRYRADVAKRQRRSKQEPAREREQEFA